MKILHVIPSVGAVRGGPSVMVRTLAQGLVDHGVESHIATTDDNGPGRLDVSCDAPVVEKGVTYWYFRRQSRFYTFSWPLTAWLAGNVGNYDLVHIHALFSYATCAAAYWARRRDVPYIVRPLGVLNRWGMAHRRPALKKLSFELIERRILRNAALIHFTSDLERAEAMDLHIRTRSVIIPNPLPAPPDACLRGRFRERFPQLEGRRIILFLSRFDRKKGLDLLLDAFAAIRKSSPGAVLVLAGEGDPVLTAELHAQAERLGLSTDVLWTGFLDGAEKWAALAGADVFVLPSYSENFGIAVVEAMAAGAPVVISDQVGIHQEVERARAGAIVACEPEALAQAIVRMLNDPMRVEMGARGRSLARSQYSLEAVTLQLIAAYEEVARQAGTGVRSARSSSTCESH